MSSSLRQRAGAALAGATALLLAACGSSGGAGSGAASGAASGGKPGSATTSTTLLLDWFPNPDHIALYLAAHDGDFAAHGLRVTFQSPSNATDALKLVSLGQVPLAVSYEPNVLTAAAQGLNVTAVAALIPTPLDTLIISGKSGVTSPAGLVGKSVGTTGDPVANALYGAILKRYGISAKQTTLVTVNEGLIPAMVTRKVAGIVGGFRNVEGIQLKLRGLEPKVYRFEQNGVPDYDELVIAANRKKLAADPQYRAMIRAFLAGLAKGNAAAQADPSAALAALRPAAKGYNEEELKSMVAATAPLLANAHGFGAMKVSSWQSFADWMKAQGLISTPVDAAKYVNTTLLPPP